MIWVGLVLSGQVFLHSKTSSAKGLQSDVEQVDEEELRVGEEASQIQCQQGWEQAGAEDISLLGDQGSSIWFCSSSP